MSDLPRVRYQYGDDPRIYTGIKFTFCPFCFLWPSIEQPANEANMFAGAVLAVQSRVGHIVLAVDWCRVGWDT